MKRFFGRIYQYWLGFGHAIGVVMTPIQLLLVYLIVFGPARFLTLLAGKDLLDRRMCPHPSYWKVREHHPADLGGARRQF